MLLPALLLSCGAAGLVYQVVWMRMLARAFGGTAAAVGVVTAAFMGGLALGSWLGGQRAARSRLPLRDYGFVELALAASALAASWAALRLPAVAAALGEVAPGTLLLCRLLLSFLVLALPTALMGASLPLAAEESARAGCRAKEAPLLYGTNLLGAAAGAMWAGWAGVAALGEMRATLAAALVNASAGAAALVLASPAAKGRANDGQDGAPALAEPSMAWVAAGSGFCALAAEGLWTRLLVLVMGSSTYAFSAMLAAVLLGLGAGSLALSRFRAPSREGLSRLLAATGFALLLGYALFAVLGLSRSDPVYLYSPLAAPGGLASLALSAAVVILPAAAAYGAVLPAAFALGAPGGGGRAFGLILAANTAGSMAGALAAGFLLAPALGPGAGVCMLALVQFAMAAALAGTTARTLARSLIPGALLAALLGWTWDPARAMLDRRLSRTGLGRIVWHHEGAHAAVSVADGPAGPSILVNGIVVSEKGRLGELFAHLPLALAARAERAAVIGLGAGMTFAAALAHGAEVDLAELEPGVIEAFPILGHDPALLRHPRARLRREDGRQLLLCARAPYDAIIVDVSPPVFSAGAVNLYSVEFLALARRRLAPGGVLALWVPAPCLPSAFWSVTRAVLESFPAVAAWSHPRAGGVLLLASERPLSLDERALARRVDAAGLGGHAWLKRPGLLGPGRVVRGENLRARALAYPAVSDDRPVTEFPLFELLAGAREVPAAAALLPELNVP